MRTILVRYLLCPSTGVFLPTQSPSPSQATTASTQAPPQTHSTRGVGEVRGDGRNDNQDTEMEEMEEMRDLDSFLNYLRPGRNIDG